ncbi:Tubby-like F-box protein 2 [Hibiscus syriacus]|uniref:Tubby-like F-box protein 2 n=1 Tax=Hibiscus syriacus TaxID=106335 RepID=A0A6A3BY93_HIBSY|nr:Tubby-like F-box protein 2 [Hibiscus syriacus]
MKDGIGNISKRGGESKLWRSRTRSHVVQDQPPVESECVEQCPWANLPPELLLDIIHRVEESETAWPARAAVVFCAAVCRSWREITKEIVKTPEQCGRLTFPISLKQPGPRESPIQCYIRRDRATSTYLLFYGLVPSEGETHKLLLAARKVRRATCTDFVISLAADDFARASYSYAGKLRQVLQFDILCFLDYTSLMPRVTLRVSFQVSPRLPACNYSIGAITYELNVLRTRGPRRMTCILHSIPVSAIQEGGTAPTPLALQQSFNDQLSPLPSSKGKGPLTETGSPGLAVTPLFSLGSGEPLTLKNKAPRWHEQLQCWCLNFRGRVTVASVKNFQLVAAVEPAHNVSPENQEKERKYTTVIHHRATVFNTLRAQHKENSHRMLLVLVTTGLEYRSNRSNAARCSSDPSPSLLVTAQVSQHYYAVPRKCGVL